MIGPLTPFSPFAGLYGRRGGFSPASIFANSENGSLLEAPTLDTLYTDDAGTTQATVGDPMGLWLDKRKGLVKGPDIASGINDAANWTGAGTNTVENDGGVKVSYVDNANGAFIAIDDNSDNAFTEAPQIGTYYVLKFSLTVGQGNTSITSPKLGNYNAGEYEIECRVIPSDESFLQIKFNSPSAGDNFTINNISVRELPGNHATQPTAANRMVVSGTGPYYLNPDAVNDNFEISLGAGFTGDFCLILDTGPIFGSIDTGTNTTWNYTVNPAYIPDGNVHALIVVDRAFTSAEKQGLVDHYADAVTSAPSTAKNAFRGRTDLTALDASYGDWTGVTNARDAFANCSSLGSAVNLDNWNPTILTDGENMMSGISAAGFDQTAYDSALTAWDAAYDLTTVNTLSIHFGSAQYGSGAPATARGILDANGWTITDGGEAV